MDWPNVDVHRVTYVYDVFVSYNSKDALVAEDIARALEDRFGFHVWKDNWQLTGGDDWVDKLPQAISASRSVLALVGSNGTGPWHREEIKVALLRAVPDKSIRIIPVALPGSPARLELPAFTGSKHIVDLRILDDWGLYLLYCAIVNRAPGRRDHFTAAQTAGVARRLNLDCAEVTHDQLTYTVRCRAANDGESSLVISHAIGRVHRVARHPIEKELPVLRAPIGETWLSQTLRVPVSENSHAVSSPFKPARYIRPGEIEDLMIPVEVAAGFRLVLSIGIRWGVPDESLLRLTEIGYIALGRRGVPQEGPYILNFSHYFPNQHSLDLPSFVRTPDWPSHWPNNVSAEEWAHYRARETGL